MSLFRKIADNEDPSSMASRLRHRRFSYFRGLLDQLPRPVTILDVGGTEGFWKRMGFRDEGDTIHITLLNLVRAETTLKNVTSVTGDARKMGQFGDKSFDIVFSNSVIEHVGPFEDQKRMSDEVRRVGKRYFIQTPNKFFPIEPHFLFPFFQFLPLSTRVWIASHYTVGWACRPGDPVAARQEVESIRLLTKREFRQLFPEATLYKEKFCGLTKSFIVHHGWNQTA